MLPFISPKNKRQVRYKKTPLPRPLRRRGAASGPRGGLVTRLRLSLHQLGEREEVGDRTELAEDDERPPHLGAAGVYGQRRGVEEAAADLQGGEHAHEEPRPRTGGRRQRTRYVPYRRGRLSRLGRAALTPAFFALSDVDETSQEIASLRIRVEALSEELVGRDASVEELRAQLQRARADDLKERVQVGGRLL